MAICFGLFILSVVSALVFGVNLLYPLLFGLGLFTSLGLKKGYSLRQISAMAWTEGKTALIVVPVFLMIGAVMGLWRSSGTIAYFLYYGISAISPQWFLLTTFVLTAVLSVALGTSFGVTGTAGVVLMTLARTGGVPVAMTAGAVLSGAYFGDRCSPMSSCATLVTACTGSELYSNVRQMLKTAALPTMLSLVFYGAVSLANPMMVGESAVLDALQTQFVFHWATLLPAIVILALVLLRVPVKWAMGLSALVALALTIFLQGLDLITALQVAVFGYTPTEPALEGILNGGGITSMINASLVVFITSLYAGILGQMQVLEPVQLAMERLAQRHGIFTANMVLSLLTIMVFCNQSVMVILTAGMLRPVYDRSGQSPMTQAMDISNSGVMLAGLVPWSIALTLPLAMLGADLSAALWAVLLYLIPLCYWVTRRFFVKEASAEA